MTSRQTRLSFLLSEALHPTRLEVIDESHQHRGHSGVGDTPQETHFRIVVESPCFVGLSPVNRHKLVYRLLQEEFQRGLHALSLETIPSSSPGNLP